MIVALAFTIAVAVQAPVVNAVVEHRSVSSTLAREVDAVAQRGTAAWIGYRVPIVRPRQGRLTSTGSCCERCRLEPATDLIVLARVEARTIVEVRPIAVDCDVDAAGMPLVWLDGVKPPESVAWLATLAGSQAASRRLSESALTALALHADGSAAPALVTIARKGEPAALRSRALFWLAQRAADEAVPAITAALDQDPDTAVRKQAVFALSQMPKDEGVPRLIDLARTHRDPDVRRQAMFWLGQSKDPRAVEFFADILLK